MKRYIKSTTENHSVFDETSTHTSYYDNFLNEKDLEYMRKSKNLDGKIVMMTPDEYYAEASKIFQKRSDRNTDVTSLVKQRSNKYTDKYVNDMLNGDKFPLCYLNYADLGQEGLHRMLAAKRAFGKDVKYPVLVITPYDEDRWAEMQLYKEIRDFEYYTLDKIVEDLPGEIAWNHPYPPSNEELVAESKEFIESEAKSKGYDIQIDCEVADYDGELRLDVYLTNYNGHILDEPDLIRNSPWFDNMFHYKSKMEYDKNHVSDEAEFDEELDEYIADLGLSDDDLDLSMEEFMVKYGL